MLIQQYVTLLVSQTGAWLPLTLQPDFTVDPKRKTLCKSVSIQQAPGNTNPAFVAGVDIDGEPPTGSNFGVFIPAPVTSIPTAPFVIGNNAGGQNALLLESIYVKGTAAEVLHVCVEVYP